MADNFDRFTKQARQVLQVAQEEAIRLNHNYIGTEHLLLGLAKEEHGIAARVLREVGATPPTSCELWSAWLLETHGRPSVSRR